MITTKVLSGTTIIPVYKNSYKVVDVPMPLLASLSFRKLIKDVYPIKIEVYTKDDVYIADSLYVKFDILCWLSSSVYDEKGYEAVGFLASAKDTIIDTIKT